MQQYAITYVYAFKNQLLKSILWRILQNLIDTWQEA